MLSGRRADLIFIKYMACENCKKEKKVFGEVEILYEDEDILAVNKPSGLIVHSDGRTKERTLCDWILEKYPDVSGVGEPLVSNGVVIDRPGIVHRLDRETSGVMVIAKNKNSFEFLKAQFQDRETKKTYNAFVYGIVKNDFGTINLPIGRSKNDFRQYTHPPKARGEMREAVTYYEVVKRGKQHTFIKAMPKTGRTHQIRVHMKAIHHPVVCDRVYALSKPCELGFERLALHARELVFTNLKGKEVIVTSNLPPDFAKALENI